MTAVCSITALGVYLLRGFGGALSKDLALYSYAGQRVAEGAAPYVEVFERGGPLTQLLPGAGVAAARGFGLDDVLGIRVLYLGFAVAGVGLMYALGRSLFDSRPAGLVSAAVLLSFPAVIFFAANGPRDKTPLLALLIAALLALVRERWLVFGLLVSLATLTWQPVFPALAVGGLVAVVLGVDPGLRFRALGRVAFGGLIPVTVTLAIYAAIGRLDALFEGFILANAAYATNTPFFEDAVWSWDRLIQWFGLSSWLVGIGLIALFVGSGIALADMRRRRTDGAWRLLSVGGVTLVLVVWTLWDFDNFPDLFVLLPGAAVGIGFLAKTLSRRTTHGRPIAVATVALATAIALSYSIGSPATGLSGQQAAVDAVLGALPGDQVILSIEAPQPLVLSKQQNPTRFQLFDSGAVDYVDDVWPGGIEGYASWIDQQAPTIIAVGRDWVPEWLESTLGDSYWRAGSAPGWAWYVHTSIGREQLQTVRRAIVEARQQSG